MMIPVVNYIVLAAWTFSESPNERKIREPPEYDQSSGGGHGSIAGRIP